MAKLTILAGPAGKVSHELTEDVVTIGRAPDNTIQIEEASVSSRHAELTLIGDRYQLKDLGSTNGTRVNGQAATEKLLQHGDVVRFGSADARYDEQAAGDAQPLPAVEEVLAEPAITSSRPAGFENASPFARRRPDKDQVRIAVLAFAAIALVAFIASMVAVFSMQAPTP